jgi:long-chain acyl-CoA synthetase
MSDRRTFCQAFQETAASHPDDVALRTPGGGVQITWAQYGKRVRTIATGLATLGVLPGDTVAIMLTNRPEFHLVDTATLHTGATPFSIYNTSAPEQIKHMFTNAGNRVVVCETQFLDRVRQSLEGTQVEHVVCVDGVGGGTITLAELEKLTTMGFNFDARWRAVEPDDVLTIIYTSGTTGPPKGVELTHSNMMAEVDAMLSIMAVDSSDRVVSYLPDAHVANRWGVHYTQLRTGDQVTTVADIKSLIAVLPEVRPTFFGAVPQIWYKVKAAIEETLAAEPNERKRKIASWSITTATDVIRLRSAGQPIPRPLALKHRVAERLVLSKVRDRLGLDQVKLAATGAAAIAPAALEFVLALGIPCCEVWGMSETSAVAIANRADSYRIGSVGRVVPGSEIRIDEDGELLVRGPLVMKGYRSDPVKSAEMIDAEGWLHTGDIASIDADGYVTLVDRKKELIINAAGKNMSPANIENTVTVACPLVSSTVAIGDDRPYIVALITLDPDAAAAYAAAHGLPDPSPEALASDPDVLASVEFGVTEANQKLSRVEQVKKFTILPVAWEPGGDELTPTMKLRRKPIAIKYAAEIEALYSET